MICEASSYEGDLRSPRDAKQRIPRTFGGRVVKLMRLAGVKDAPFEIVKKAGGHRRRK
jgi:hypothetical protein